MKKTNTTKTKIGGKPPDAELIFVFKNVKMQAIVDPEIYDEKDAKEIDRILEIMTQEISIDKSYVDFPENKHQDTFIELEGWERLCQLVKKTQFGKKSSNMADEIVIESFKTIILGYLYSIYECLGYNIDGIALDFEHAAGLHTEFYKDTIQEWKHYPGPWQDWGLDK